MPDTSTLTQSKSIDDFLKAIYVLEQQMERVSTNALKDVLAISAPSVTDMAQRLVAAGLVDYQKYRGVVLTETGREIALKIIRRHRLIELYLVTELGYELREVHDEAERLEHAVSDRFIEAIAHKLDNPIVDPHGDPIPDIHGAITRRDLHPLSEIPLNTCVSVSRLISESPDMLQHILDRGFKLGAQVEVLARDPFDGPITARVDDQQRVIGHAVAVCILVELPESVDV